MLAYLLLCHPTIEEAARSCVDTCGGACQALVSAAAWICCCCCQVDTGTARTRRGTATTKQPVSPGSLTSLSTIEDDEVEDAKDDDIASYKLEDGLGQTHSHSVASTAAAKKTPLPPLLNFPTALSCTLVLLSLASAAIPVRWATATKQEQENLPYLLEDTR
jgi:hypothetical protein